MRRSTRTTMPKTPDELRSEIRALVEQYHAAAFADKPFEPGKTAVPYAGRVFDADELCTLVDSALDFRLTAGRYAARFEAEFAAAFGLRHCLLVNSGSSANLVALSSLTSPTLGDDRLRP